MSGASHHPHVALLGDSIFDNAAYVRGGPDVVTQLREVLPSGWTASLLAVDGAVIAGVARQLDRLPRDATHLVVSAGGNDALGHSDLLERRATSSPQVLGWLADAAEEFERQYRAMLALLLAQRLPLTLCTIYNGNLGAPVQRLASAALAVFDDVILRVAAEHVLQVIELRLVCTSPSDYANPIEPSVAGGAKIARAIARAVESLGAQSCGARILAG
jgi:lysophospholipase L1-like esterase